MNQPAYPSGAPAPQARGTNVMAILALVFAFVFAPLGIVLGHIAKRQIRRTGEDGGGLATAGLVLGYLFTIAWIIAVVVLTVLAANAPTSTT